MSATPYRAITWAPDELLSEDKMDQLLNNVQWIYENTPRATYSLSDSVVRAENVRLACGRVTIPAVKSDNSGANVSFPNFFSPGCTPIITTGVVSKGQRHVFCVVNGLGEALQPDYRGFGIWINVAEPDKTKDLIQATMYLNWMAMGY